MVTIPHTTEEALKQSPDKWLSNARLTYYQALLLDSPCTTFKEPQTLNPATLLPVPDLNIPVHSCEEILKGTTLVQADLLDEPFTNTDLVWFTDGSSFVSEWVRKAGAVVVGKNRKLIWRTSFPSGTSAQKAELVSIAEVLERTRGKRVTIYTDSRYMLLPLFRCMGPSTGKEVFSQLRDSCSKTEKTSND